MDERGALAVEVLRGLGAGEAVDEGVPTGGLFVQLEKLVESLEGGGRSGPSPGHAGGRDSQAGILQVALRLVMELMPKGSLYDVLHNGQPMDWSMRSQIAVDIAHGLYDLHQENILHRDLKSYECIT